MSGNSVDVRHRPPGSLSIGYLDLVFVAGIHPLCVGGLGRLAKHNTVEGSDVDSFLADMKVRLADIETNGVVPEEEEIVGVMDKNMTEIESKYSSLVPPYPSLADIDPESPEDDETLPPAGRRMGDSW